MYIIPVCSVCGDAMTSPIRQINRLVVGGEKKINPRSVIYQALVYDAELKMLILLPLRFDRWYNAPTIFLRWPATRKHPATRALVNRRLAHSTGHSRLDCKDFFQKTVQLNRIHVVSTFGGGGVTPHILPIVLNLRD